MSIISTLNSGVRLGRATIDGLGYLLAKTNNGIDAISDNNVTFKRMVDVVGDMGGVAFSKFAVVVANVLTNGKVYKLLASSCDTTNSLEQQYSGLASFGASVAEHKNLSPNGMALLYQQTKGVSNEKSENLRDAVLEDKQNILEVKAAFECIQNDPDFNKAVLYAALGLVTACQERGFLGDVVLQSRVAEVLYENVENLSADFDSDSEITEQATRIAVGCVYASELLYDVCLNSKAPFIKLRTSTDKMLVSYKKTDETGKTRIDLSGFGSEKYLTGKGASFEDCLRTFSNQLIFKNTLVYSL